MPWLNKPLKHLYEAFSAERLSHAYLLTGLSGLGKRELSKEFAEFLLCSDNEKAVKQASCKQCKSCHLFRSQTHPDFFSIMPEKEGGVIKIEQIKALSLWISETSHFNQYKVCLIYPAEAMNISAANSLLKVLEEPIGSKVVFLLISNNNYSIPATIKSRCQNLTFNPPTNDILKKWLAEENINFSADELAFVIKLSQGAPLAIKKLAEDESFELYLKIFNMLKSYFTNKSVITISDAAATINKITPLKFIELLQLVIHDSLQFSLVKDKIERYKLLDEINKTKQALNKGIQLNFQLLIERILLKLTTF